MLSCMLHFPPRVLATLYLVDLPRGTGDKEVVGGVGSLSSVLVPLVRTFFVCQMSLSEVFSCSRVGCTTSRTAELQTAETYLAMGV